jgi:hypothetical protein
MPLHDRGQRAKAKGKPGTLRKKQRRACSGGQADSLSLRLRLFYAVRLRCKVEAGKVSRSTLPLGASGLALVVYTCGGYCAPGVLLLALFLPSGPDRPSHAVMAQQIRRFSRGREKPSIATVIRCLEYQAASSREAGTFGTIIVNQACHRYPTPRPGWK